LSPLLGGGAILKRASLLSLLLLVAFFALLVKTYQLWQEGPWESPRPRKVAASPEAQEPRGEPARPQLVSTGNIIEKNLFDPERGAGGLRESEVTALAIQRIRGLSLNGTLIVGDRRYALITVPPEGGGAKRDIRLKVGDTIEGFQVAEIEEKRVILRKGQSTVDLALDFFKKSEVPAPGRLQRPPASPVPRVAPSRPAVSPHAISPLEKMARERREE